MNRSTIILTRYHNAVLYLMTDEKDPVELSLYFDDEESVGDIYVCEVKDVKPGIGASFVNYGKDRKGFYKRTEHKCGSLLPLQLKKEGNGDKAPVFTDDLTLAGVYTVLTSSNRDFGISSKIGPEKRAELKEQYSSFFADLEYGITLRTNSQDARPSEVLGEADELAGILDDIISNAGSRTVGSILYRQPPQWQKRCLSTDFKRLSKVVTDDNGIFEVLNSSFADVLRAANPDAYLSLYSDNLLPLFKLYSIDALLSSASAKKVWLKSGGFLYIERTESLTAIDVNTGKLTGKKDKETTFYECNIEAVHEICRQLRLRDISGIIVIDLINMENEEHLDGVIRTLKELTAADSVKTAFHDCTALNLIELTRQKIREPLEIQLKKLK